MLSVNGLYDPINYTSTRAYALYEKSVRIGLPASTTSGTIQSASLQECSTDSHYDMRLCRKSGEYHLLNYEDLVQLPLGYRIQRYCCMTSAGLVLNSSINGYSVLPLAFYKELRTCGFASVCLGTESYDYTGTKTVYYVTNTGVMGSGSLYGEWNPTGGNVYYCVINTTPT